MTAKRGRPKKPVPPVNTDELPATKGYVKCVAEKIHDHNHRQNACCIATVITATVAWTGILITGFIQAIATHPVVLLPNDVWCALIAVAIVTTVVVVDSTQTDELLTNHPERERRIENVLKKWEPPNVLKKWEPPKEEEKKGC